MTFYGLAVLHDFLNLLIDGLYQSKYRARTTLLENFYRNNMT